MSFARRIRCLRVKLLRRRADALRDRALGFLDVVRRLRARAAAIDTDADRIEREGKAHG